MLRELLHSAIRRPGQTGVTPGGVLLYGDQGRDLEVIPFGWSHSEPPETAFPVTAETVYDIASITKPIAVAGVLMKLGMDPHEPAHKLLPELAAGRGHAIMLAHLLGHASGLPAHQRFYERIRAGDLAGASNPREALWRMVAATELARPPGTEAVYSDLGYIALGTAIERLTGKRLDAVVAELVTGPLDMADTFYIDLLDLSGLAGPVGHRPRPLTVIAPTEVCPYRGLVHGAVHDDNAHAGGGIFGHAGLFSTAGDLGRFARAIMLAATASPSAPGRDAGGFDPAVVQQYLASSAAPGTSWRLGWDTPAGPLSHAGNAWPRSGVGHLGFTGCSLWLDPPRGRYVVLLTNRVHPSRELPGIRELRRAVMDTVVATLSRP